MVTDQDFHSQAVESPSCGFVDSRKPCCYEPPEEDTGSVVSFSSDIHAYIWRLYSTSEAGLFAQVRIFICFVSLEANRPAGLSGQHRCSPRERRGQNAHSRQPENCLGIWINLHSRIKNPAKNRAYVIGFFLFASLQKDQLNRNKVPEWQRIAGKAAKEVEKFAKAKADLVLMHWRDKMGIAQKEVSIRMLTGCRYFRQSAADSVHVFYADLRVWNNPQTDITFFLHEDKQQS